MIRSLRGFWSGWFSKSPQHTHTHTTYFELTGGGRSGVSGSLASSSKIA